MQAVKGTMKTNHLNMYIFEVYNSKLNWNPNLTTCSVTYASKAKIFPLKIYGSHTDVHVDRKEQLQTNEQTMHVGPRIHVFVTYSVPLCVTLRRLPFFWSATSFIMPSTTVLTLKQKWIFAVIIIMIIIILIFHFLRSWDEKSYLSSPIFSIAW